MNLRRSIIPLTALAIALGHAAAADAHRLDEYLQATLLSIAVDRIDLEIDLTPGVNIATEALGWIDVNGDGRISPLEADAYARGMLGDVLLSVDGRSTPVTFVDVRCPEPGDMRLGVGTIRVRATAGMPAAASGRHEISYLNRHRPDVSVYLVNALAPVDPRIEIGSQRRDVAQRGVTVAFNAAPSPIWVRASSVAAGFAVIGVLGWRRRRSSAAGIWFAAQTATRFSTESVENPVDKCPLHSRYVPVVEQLSGLH